MTGYLRSRLAGTDDRWRRTVPTALKKTFAEIDVLLVAAYGLTETTDGSLFLRPEDAIRKGPKCNGMSFMYVDAKIVDKDLSEVEPGERGELLHRGPTVANGYWNRPETTEEEWVDGGSEPATSP